MLITLLKISRNVVAWNFEMEKIGVKKCIARRDLYGFDIEPNVRSNIKALFTINKTKAYVGFRVYSNGEADIYVDRVILKQVSGEAENELFGEGGISRL